VNDDSATYLLKRLTKAMSTKARNKATAKAAATPRSEVTYEALARSRAFLLACSPPTASLCRASTTHKTRTHSTIKLKVHLFTFLVDLLLNVLYKKMYKCTTSCRSNPDKKNRKPITKYQAHLNVSRCCTACSMRLVVQQFHNKPKYSGAWT